MKELSAGDELEAGSLLAPGAEEDAPIVVHEGLVKHPHGARYRAKQSGIPVLVTVVDPLLVADAGAKAQLQRNLKAAGAVSHRSLLPLYGFERTSAGFLILEGDVDGTTVRRFLRHRIARGKSLDGETAYTLVAHVCNALAELNETLVHGYVNSDTVLVSNSGRVFLSCPGAGSILASCRDFARFRQADRLPNIAPEQLLSPPKLTPGTDVFGVATLFLEMVTGQPLKEAGQPVAELGLRGPSELVQCLERATAPSMMARPPDVATFKSELAEAVRSAPIERGIAGHRGAASTGEMAAQTGGAAPDLPDPMAVPQPMVSAMPGYPPGAMPGYPPGAMPGYPPSAMPGYPPGAMPGYPPGAMPGYPPGAMPGYPPGAVPGAMPGYPPGAMPGYPPGAMPGYPPGAMPPGAIPRPPSESSAPLLGVPADDDIEEVVPEILEPRRPKSSAPLRAPPPAPGSPTRNALAELEAAMGRIELSDDTAGLTSLVDGSEAEEEDDEPPKKAKTPAKAKAPAKVPAKAKAAPATKPTAKPKAAGGSRPTPGAKPGDSLLNLTMEFEDAVRRISTVDGAEASLTGAAVSRDAVGPSGSGTYFPTFGESDRDDDEPIDRSSDPPAGDPRKLFFLVVDRKHEGPLSMAELVERAREGTLAPTAVLVNRENDEERPAISFEAIERTFTEMAEQKRMAALGLSAPTRTPVQGPGRRGGLGGRAWGTLLLVVLVVAGFSVAGWFLYRGGM